VRVVLIGRDLLFGSRISVAAEHAGADLIHLDHASGLPAPASVDLVLVDWSARAPDWGEALRAWSAEAVGTDRLRIVLFGPHTDLPAHAAARAAGLGPMWARSKLLAELPRLMEDETPAAAPD
jgi:hypothetical protein